MENQLPERVCDNGTIAVDTETLEEKAQILSAEAVITETPLMVREVKHNFLLITYDIPNSVDGTDARAKFLKEARRIGAVMHSESSYYLPWGQEADALAITLAAVDKSKVFVWYAGVDETTASALLLRYDERVRSWMDALDERLDRIAGHIGERKLKLADNMLERTVSMLKDMRGIVERRVVSSSPTTRGYLTEDLKRLTERIGDVASALVIAMHRK